jgi:hypothetical protein
MGKQLVLPRVHAMVVCDGIEESDDEEGVFHLYGVRTWLSAELFPFICSELWVYAQVAGHPGTVPGPSRLFKQRPMTKSSCGRCRLSSFAVPLSLFRSGWNCTIVSFQSLGYTTFKSGLLGSCLANACC